MVYPTLLSIIKFSSEVRIFNFSENFPGSSKLSDFFPTSLGSFQAETFQLRTFQLKIFQLLVFPAALSNYKYDTWRIPHVGVRDLF